MFSKFLDRLDFFVESIKKTLHDLEEEWEYDFWKLKVQKAQENRSVAYCRMCDGPITSGDPVAKQLIDGKDEFVHAGYHYTLANMDEIVCAPLSMKYGVWNGTSVDVIGESTILKRLKIEKSAPRNY